MILLKVSRFAEARWVLTLEFPHLLRLIELNEFDTIYHEHFSYFSLISTAKILEAHGLRVFDVEELKSHGGSLRVFACRAASQAHATGPNVQKVIGDEVAGSSIGSKAIRKFARQVRETKFALVEFLLSAAQAGQDSCRLRSAGQERYPAPLLRHRKRPDRIHGGSQSVQARSLPAGQPHSDLPPRPDSRN